MPKSIVLAIFMSVIGLFADEWAPIPPDVWAIRSGVKGAVVLEERIQFRYTSVEYVYRVRVFNEEGRSAAGIPDLPSTASDIRGRTVYPDGRQVLFNSRKDFAERKVEYGSSEKTATHIIPPGITTDCVMEVAWSEVANGMFKGLPQRYERGLYAHWTLANPVPTKLMVIEVAKTYPLAWILDHGSMAKPESTEKSGYRVITFHDLPALEIPPYGLKPTLRLPTLVIYYQPESLRGVFNKDPEAFWQEAASSLYKSDYESGISKGSRYRDFAAAILEGLPAAPAERAVELLNRLNQNIANLSSPTKIEEAALPKDFWEHFDPKDLGEAIKAGRTSSRGMRLLYYHLLKQAGFIPKIGKLVDRDEAFFQWGHKNPWQFHHEVIGIDLPSGTTIWLDPSLRHATPGVIHPDYTGVIGLQIDTSTWKATRVTIPSRDSASNGRKYTYKMALEEESDSVQLQGEFTGYPEYAERWRYLPLESREQGKALRERFEKAMKNFVISEVQVLNANNPSKDVTWQLSGTIERESGRTRVVDPFPGMPWPLNVPSQLEQERKVPIVIPYLFTQVGICKFKVPDGFKFLPVEEMNHENEFGKVIWASSYDSKSGEVSVAFRVEARAISMGADHWPAFRAFLGWIETACRRQVALAKVV